MTKPKGDHISPWIPEADPVTCAVLAKLVEELNEAGARAARCQAQGVMGMDPDHARANLFMLADEIADLSAAVMWAKMALGLCLDDTRMYRKLEGFQRWEKLIKDASK